MESLQVAAPQDDARAADISTPLHGPTQDDPCPGNPSGCSGSPLGALLSNKDGAKGSSEHGSPRVTHILRSTSGSISLKALIRHSPRLLLLFPRRIAASPTPLPRRGLQLRAIARNFGAASRSQPPATGREGVNTPPALRGRQRELPINGTHAPKLQAPVRRRVRNLLVYNRERLKKK